MNSTQSMSKIDSKPTYSLAESQLKSTDGSDVNRPIKDKWALVIGISKFKNPNISLKYAAKDAQDFRDYLIREGNFAADHVKLLTNEQATQRAILSELGDKWLPRVANPDDLIIIYISSHGSSADYDVDADNFLIAYDTDIDDLYTTAIDMQDLARIIKRRVHSDRVAIILDACHSGATTPDAKGLTRAGLIDAGKVAQGAGQLVVSSSKPDQLSWELKNESNSAFTKYLIAGLRLNGTNTKLGDAYSFMKDKVQEVVLRERGVLQTPILKSAWRGEDLRIAVVPVSPRAGVSTESASVENKGASASVGKQSSEGAASAPASEKTSTLSGSPPPEQSSQEGSTQVATATTSRPPIKAHVDTSVSPQTRGNYSVLVLPCEGPLNCSIHKLPPNMKDLWGTVQDPHDFDNLASIISQRFSYKLSEKLPHAIVHETASNQSSSSAGLAAWRQSAAAAGARYLVKPTLEKAAWDYGTMSNKYILVGSVELIDAATGNIVWQLRDYQVRKAPLTGDMKGGRAFFEREMAPLLADELFSHFFKGYKSATSGE